MCAVLSMDKNEESVCAIVMFETHLGIERGVFSGFSVRFTRNVSVTAGRASELRVR